MSIPSENVAPLLQKVADTIQEHGYAVILRTTTDDTLNYAHTAGLSGEDTHDFILPANLDHDDLFALLNLAVEACVAHGQPFESSLPLTESGIRFTTRPSVPHPLYPVTVARRFAQPSALRLDTVILSDLSGSFPWDAGYDTALEQTPLYSS